MNQGGTADHVEFVLDRTYFCQGLFCAHLTGITIEFQEVRIMNISPALSDVEKIAATGKYDVLYIPVTETHLHGGFEPLSRQF